MKLISVDDLIKILKEKKIDLGKGDPYNRIRYYTKIGWLPHMIRKKNENKIISGHYPEDVIEKIIFIEKIKAEGLSNEEITKKIKELNSINNRNVDNRSFILEKILNSIKKNFSISKVLILLIVTTLFIDLIFFRDNQSNINEKLNQNNFSYEKIDLPSGETFIPKGQNKIFINNEYINNQDTILISFEGSIFPASFYFISEIKEGQGFYLETNMPVSNEVKLKWVVIKK
jgi:DNA-binding transcriptional MerR regulator